MKLFISNVDEDQVKESLLVQQEQVLYRNSKNLAELKSIKVSSQNPDRISFRCR